MNLHVFLAQDVGLERLLAVGAHEVLVLGMAGHVSSNRTGLKTKILRSIFLKWQPCHSSAEAYGFHQINHTIEL